MENGDLRGISMREKRFRLFFIPLGMLFLIFSTGCGLLNSYHERPKVQEVPPYYEHNDLSKKDRFHHEQGRESITDQVHIVHNREMERLVDLENEEKETETTKEKRAKFWAKFKFNDKNFLRSEEASRISSNLDR
jgi:hypothetical protein